MTYPHALLTDSRMGGYARYIITYRLAKELKDMGFPSNGQAWNETLKEILQNVAND